MKVGVLSDIHGNFDALLAVLESAKRKGVEHLLILGDIVGYYYHPDKILNELSSWNCTYIKGNHEHILEKLINDPNLEESIRLKYGSGHKEAILKLSEEQLHFLKQLPDTQSCRIDGVDFFLSHGSPWENDFYIYPDSESTILEKCNSSTHDFVLIGHSHYAFSYRNSHSLLINPGSVGQSRQQGGQASWALINTENKTFQQMSTPYLTVELLAEIAQKDPDIEYLSNILKRKA